MVLVAVLEEAPREARATVPLTVFSLECQQPRTPTFCSDSRALCRDDLSRRTDDVAYHLPANGGIRIEQPIDDGHAAESNMLMRQLLGGHR